MNSSTNTARASLLVLVVVLSVGLGGVAGATDGTSTASVQEAVEYDGTIELALDSNTGSAIQASNVDVWVDGKSRSVSVAEDGTNGRIVLTGLDDVSAHRSITVRIQQSGTLETGNVSVTVTGAVLNANEDANIFAGAPIAYVGTGTDVTMSITKEGSFLMERGTGQNSKVYVIDTSGQETGATYYVNETSGASSSYTLRDLGLTASANTTSVDGGGSVSVSVSSNGAVRPIVFRLVDSSSGDVVKRKVIQLGSDGTAEGAFHGLSSGTYVVEVEDGNTGTTTSTSEINVGQTQAGSVVLASTIMTDQRGDVITIALEFQGGASGDTAEVTIGNSEVNFEVTATVTDGNDDGTATLLWNTANSNANDAGLSVRGGSLDSVQVSEGVDQPVDTGDYPVSVTFGGDETDLGTAVIEARSTDGVSVMTAPASNSQLGLDAATAADGTVALDQRTFDHDWVVLRVEASGLEGYVSSAGDIDGSNGLTLDITESEETVGTNEDPLTVDASQGTLIADAENDTYYLGFQPEALVSDAEPGDKFEVTFTVGSDNAVTDSTQEVTTSFTFVNGTASFDQGGLQVPPSSEATITGTSTFAPGTELEVRIRNEGGTSPFTKSKTVTVGADGTWSATFDLSDVPAGTTFTARISKGTQGRVMAEGEVVEQDTPTETEMEETPTETEPEATPTSTPAPGFGLVAGLAALVAVALLRRRN